MTFRRNLWQTGFEASSVPKYPCPSCAEGRLIVDASASFLEEPRFSTIAQGHEDWEPDWITERFSERLRCDNEQCGEIAMMVGETHLIESFDEEYGNGLIGILTPRAFFPAPPMIDLPEQASSRVISEIKSAFALFWMDVGSAGNRLRTSLEYVLDDLKVPRENMSEDSKPVYLNLNGRINLIAETVPEQAKTFHALRMVGNLGSHTAQLSTEAFLDALELYEDAMSELYGKRKNYLDALKEKIIKTKGKY